MIWGGLSTRLCAPQVGSYCCYDDLGFLPVGLGVDDTTSLGGTECFDDFEDICRALVPK